MKLYFLILELETGKPIFIKNYGMIKQEENVLISGLLTAIQSLLMEMKMGKIRSIKTDEYTITGEITGRLAYFLIGDFEVTPKIKTFLTQLQETFAPAEDQILLESRLENNQQIMDTLNTIVDIHVKKFLRQELEVGMLFQTNSDLVNLYDIDDVKTSELVFSYIANMSHVFYPDNYSFYLQLQDDTGVLIYKHKVETAKNQGELYLFMTETSEDALEEISFKPLFSEMAMNFIDQNVDYILEIHNTEDKEKKAELDYLIATFIEDFNASQRARAFVFEEKKQIRTLTAIFDEKQLLEIISILLQGQPIAITESTPFSKEKIHVLSHLLDVYNGNLNPEEITTIYPRITLTRDALKNVTEELGYAVIDGTKIFGKKHHIDTKCFEYLITRNYNGEKDDPNSAMELEKVIKHVVKEITLHVLELLRLYLFNEHYQDYLNMLSGEKKDCMKMYLQIAQWFMPHFKHPLLKPWKKHYIDW